MKTTGKKRDKKKTSDDPLAELHEIRAKNYEETKHMSATEYVEHTRKRFETIKELFIKPNAA